MKVNKRYPGIMRMLKTFNPVKILARPLSFHCTDSSIRHSILFYEDKIFDFEDDDVMMISSGQTH
jgi:hypothetical protein